jgi:hypothetical protein
VTFVSPPANELADARRRQLAEQGRVPKEMKISPDLLPRSCRRSAAPEMP